MRALLSLPALFAALTSATPALAAPADLETFAPPVRWVDQDGGCWLDQRYVAGDFDGDGLADVARIYDRGDGATNVDVFRGNGSGLAWTRWIDAGGSFWTTQQWLAADVDGDGDDDLIRAFDDWGLTTLDGLMSDGTRFTYSRRVSRLGAWTPENQLVAGDFDGDGRDDIARVFGESGETSVDIFPGGAPPLQRWTTRDGGFWGGMHFVAGDVDGDGLDDIARIFSDAGQASVDLLRSSGAGFTGQRAVTRAGATSPGARARMGDLDDDGRADIVLVEPGAGLKADALLSDGLTFARHPLFRSAVAGDFQVLDDFDGDGKAELMVVQAQFGLTNMDAYGVAPAPWEYRARPVRWAGDMGAFGDDQVYLAGDFDGDEMPDIARVFPEGGLTSIDVQRNTADGFEYQRWTTRQGGHWGGMVFVVGDYTGDGRDDIVKIFEEGGLTSMDVFVAQPQGGFVFSRWITRHGGHWGGMRFLAGDFDGDGRADVAKVFADGFETSVDVYPSAGDHFPGSPRWITRMGVFWDSQEYIAGDFDGDARDDIARIFDDGGQTTIDVLPSTGVAFGHERWLTRTFPHVAGGVHVAGDFDGDGVDDVVKAYPTPEGRAALRLYPARGRAFGTAHLTDTDAVFSLSGRVLAADFDLDGRAEVATVYRTAGSFLTSFDVYGGETATDPTLIATAGDTHRHTPAQAAAVLAASGLTLVARAHIGPGECTVVYPNADAMAQSRDLGLLSCAVQLGGDVQLHFTPVYGGCDIASGAQCSIGVFATTLTIDGPVPAEIEVKGPSAELCGAVSREAVCADVGANLWSSSFLVTDGNGNGGGAGIYAGVGAGAGARYDSGVLSGSFNLGLGAGFDVTWSVNAGAVVSYAAEGFVYVVEGVDWGITAAGDAAVAVRDGLEDAADAVGSAFGSAADAVGDFFGGLF